MFVRVADADGYNNFGWYVFKAGESDQVLDIGKSTLIHDHSKKIFFYAEGIGNDLVWSSKAYSTQFEGETYNLSESSNTNDENDTPILLTCR